MRAFKWEAIESGIFFKMASNFEYSVICFYVTYVKLIRMSPHYRACVLLAHPY